MANQYVNKVQLADGTVLIDISSDTVTRAKLVSGYTAHDSTGAEITGIILNQSELIVYGNTVTALAGYYETDVTGTVDSGTVTNNTTLPSGKSSSGTVNRGNYIKIGTGYHTEKYYKAQANSGTKNITSSGTTSVDGYANVNVPKTAIVISVSATSSTSKTISNSSITADHYVYITASTEPDADVSWSTSSGSITLTCSEGIPAMQLMLCLDM